MGTSESPAESIFFEAMARGSPELRARYVEEACAGDAALRSRVERLLAAQPKVGDFLESPAAADLTDVADPASRLTSPTGEGPGTVIGPYKLLELIGEGGFGSVFLAEQTQPVRRQVALKIVKAGMDSRQVVARFEAERQALAVMDHPNIARVFDAGTTEAGRPYFVMELVKGVPITTFCDERRLPPRERLRLFIDVCHAVQHAHQKGIIHRDLKPSNVLVALYDERPVPKVIDFGVAKALGATLTDRTMFTGVGAIVGTLEYMPPEQAQLNQLDVDTRSDIYSLGVMLYELLTGGTPIGAARMKRAALDEVLRIIRQEDPPRPSTRLSTADGLASIAANRGLEPKQLNGLVRGELDWIVMKALEKDRQRRYETANGFARDVERYLNDEAVQACPPSARYRFGKFARRNRAALLTASLIVAALLAGSALATWQAVVATRARRGAVAAAIAEKTAKVTAEAREAETRAVLDFVQNKVFAAARPEGQDGGLGREVTLRNAVEAALPFVENGFASQPVIEARLRTTLGVSFWYLGEPAKAAEQFDRARTLLSVHRGPDHFDTLASVNNLANCYAKLGRHADALKLHEQTLAIETVQRGPDDRQTLRTMGNVANSYNDLGRHADALAVREKVFAIEKASLGPDHSSTVQSMGNLANSYASVGRHADAVKLKEETLALQKTKLGPDHPDTLQSMYNLANSYEALGRDADALTLREETLALRRVKLGSDHPATLRSMINLAESYSHIGRHADALKLSEETLMHQRAKHGPDHPATLRAMLNLASRYAMLGRDADALKLREETLGLMKAKLGPNHPDTLVSMANLAASYVAVGRHAEARPIIDDCLARVSGQVVDSELIPTLLELRLRVFQHAKEPARCLETATDWDALKRTDAPSLYQSACFRAVCAAVIKETDKTPAGEAKAKEQADQAMAWLKQAVAAGYNDTERMKDDKSLDAVRDRADFKKLLAELQAAPTSTTLPTSRP